MKFVVYAFHNDSSGKEHLAMEFARAKGYSDKLQDNVLRGIIQQEMKGRGTRPLSPAFTVIDDEESPDHLKIVPSPLHEHWRNAYRWKIEGKTNAEIATLLLEAGYRHRQKYKKKWRTVKVDKDYVGRHLKNPLHFGWLVTKETSKEPRYTDFNEIYDREFHEAFPVVVTREDFKKVNPKLFSDTAKQTDKPRKRSKYPLAGKVLCKERHDVKKLATMFGNTPTSSTGKPSPRYTCTRCKPSHGVSMDDIFNAVAEELRTIKLTEREHKKLVVTEWVRFERERDEMEATRRQINALKGTNEKEKSKAEETLNEMKWGSPRATQEQIATQKKKIERLREERKNLLAREKKLDEQYDARYDDLDAFLELSKNASRWWKKASDEKKRRMGELLISNVVIKGNKVASVSLEEPFAT